MQQIFKDQVVIITGASSGIGAAAAKLFARHGAIPVLVARNERKLHRVASQIKLNGGTTFVIPTDITLPEKVEEMVAEVVRQFGQIDILFNNAGSSFVGKVTDATFVENLQKMIDLDLMGTVYCTRAVLPIMKKQNKGHIVNMSSVVGKKAFPNFTGYSSVMHAISGFTDGLRQELRSTHIGVSIIHPALTQTALLQHVAAADMPGPFKAITPMPVEQVATAVVQGVYHRKPKVVVPFQPKVLLFLDALSVRLADWFVQLVSKPFVGWLLGMYKGRLYHEY